MTQRPRFPDSESDQLPREVIDLGQSIAQLPQLPKAQRDELERSYERVVESVRRRRRILALVQESLAQLRLDLKYLMFDLELTRQEREELRQRLNDES